MRTMLYLLLPWFLAQEPAVVHGLTLDLHTQLGVDPDEDIQLAMPGG
jgi:hypothetical protein